MDAIEILLLRLVYKNPGSDKSAVVERALPILSAYRCIADKRVATAILCRFRDIGLLKERDGRISISSEGKDELERQISLQKAIMADDI